MPLATSSRRNASLIRGLLYFEAVARHQSVKSAAEELGVSQSAVSHQIRELTKVLGEQLLVRKGRGVAVSPSGQQLAGKLSATFLNLHSMVEEIIGTGRKTLRLAVCSSFGPGWLIPRLKDFISSQPDIDLQLQLYAEDPQLTDQVADAIVSALPVQPGYAAIHLIDEMLVAVHAAGSAGRRHRLITTDIEEGKCGLDWLKYCRHAGLRLDDLQDGPWLQCTHYMLALEMARTGLGIALVPDFLARREVETGALAYFDRHRMPSQRSYHLCFKHARGQEPGMRALVHWLKGKLTASPVLKFTTRPK